MIDKMPLIKECVLPEPGRMLDPNDPDLGELMELIKMCTVPNICITI